MPKTRFSVVDCARMAAEVNHLLAGSWVQNIYTLQDDAKTFLFKLTGRGDKYFLLLESGVRFHPTEFVRDKSESPTGFAMKLRKHVRGRRLEYCRQVGLDRVVDFAFGKGTQHHHVVLEMYAGGNVILTDEKGIILTLLRPYTLEDGDLRVAVGQKYPFDLALEGPRALLSEQTPATTESISSFFETFLVQVAEEEAKFDAESESDEEAEVKPKKGPVTVKGEKPAAKPQKRKKKKDRKKRPAELDRKRELAQALSSKGSPVQSFGPQLIEHCLVNSGFDPTTRIADMTFITENAEKLAESLKEAPRILSTLRDESVVLPGIITTAESSSDYYEDFEPFKWSTFKSKSVNAKEFSTFHLAVDDYFAKIESQRAAKQRQAQERANHSKIENVRKQQAERVEQLMNAVEERERQARLLEANAELVDQCIGAVNTLLSNGMTWDDADRVVRMEKSNGNPVAACISSLKLAENRIVIILEDDEDDDYDDESSQEESEAGEDTAKAKSNKQKKPSRVLVEVDLSLSAQANVAALFAEKKRAAIKAKVTEEKSHKAVEEMEAKLAQQDRKKSAKGATGGVRQARKPFWFEKFHWFITSEGVLVLGGKDAHQNEQLFKRFLRKGDAYLHADIHGAPTVIVRNPYYKTGTARTIPFESMREAGIFCVCKSAAWQAKIVTSAWWVESYQVSRTAPSGEYLPTGSFMIRGKKNYLQPTRLEMGFGYIFKIDETAKDADVEEGETFAKEEQEEDGPREWRFLRGKLPPLSEELLASLNETVQSASEGEVYSVISVGTVPTKQARDNSKAGSQAGKGGSDKGKGNQAKAEAQGKSNPQSTSSTALKKKLLKQKRVKAKYGDQTEEERRLAMIALGHALPDVPPKADSKSGTAESDNDDDTEEGNKGKSWLEQNSAQQREQAGDTDANVALSNEEETAAQNQDDDDDEAEAEKAPEIKVEVEEDEEADAPVGEEELLRGFTANPGPDDTILYAIPVCAPMESMTHFKFRVKLTPGQLKKGKAAKQAVALFQSKASNREKAVVNQVTDPENVAVMMMDVKVSAPGLEKVRAIAKSQQKQAKKEINASKGKSSDDA